jgi:hypothetical protein
VYQVKQRSTRARKDAKNALDKLEDYKAETPKPKNPFEAAAGTKNKKRRRSRS